MFTMVNYAQTQSPAYVTYNTYVGCAEGENPDRKTFEELISSGLCLRQCQSSITGFNIHSAFVPTGTVWTVTGGVIQSQGNNFINIKWGTTNAGSIQLTTTINGETYIYPLLCIDLKINPSADFTIAPATATIKPGPYEACSGQIVNFLDLSSANGGTAINNREWDFGDGTTSQEINPSHLYEADSTYTVRYRVTNQCFCVSETSLEVVVGKKGVPITCASVVCYGEKATYTIPPNVRDFCTTFDWSVIGGTIVSPLPYGESIDVVWNSTVANDGFGYVTFNPATCQVDCYKPTTIKIPIINTTTVPSALSQKIVWETNPTATTINICGEDQHKFKLPQWPSTEFTWQIVNSANTNADYILTDQRNEVLLNPGTGNGTVTLKCTYYNTLLKCGGVAANRTINIKQNAEIIGETKACVGSQGSYTTESGLSATWKIRRTAPAPTTAWSPGLTATVFEPVFDTAGTYQINLSGTNFCSAVTKTVVVSSVTPVPLTVSNNSVMSGTQVVGSSIVCPGSPSTFTINNTVPNTVLVWGVMNGQILGPSRGNTVTMNFNLMQTPNYQLIVFRESTVAPYCQSIVTTIPLIVQPPNPNITGFAFTDAPNINPCGSSLQSYSNNTVGADSFEWYVDPPSAGTIVGSTATEYVQVLWNEPIAGQFPKLKVKINKCNKESIIQLPVTISSPQITLSTPLLTFCSGTNQTFTLTSNPVFTSPSPATTVTWNFGDGTIETTSNEFTRDHIFNNTSTSNANYTVTVTIVNPNGCNNVIITKTMTVTVQPQPVAHITPATSRCGQDFDAIDLVDRQLTLDIQNSNGVTIKWFRDNLEIMGATTANYTVTSFGVYHATVNNGFCTRVTNSVSFFFCNPPVAPCTIVPNPTINLTTTSTCGVITGQASYTSTPLSMAWWDLATSQVVSTTSSMSVNKVEPGSYLFLFEATYTGTDGQPCKKAQTVSVIVPYIVDIKHDITCPSNTAGQYNVTLYDYSKFFADTPITSWAFYVNNVLQPINTTLGDINTNRHITLAPGTYTLKLIVGRAGQASCTKIVTLVLPNFPTASIIGGEGIHCEGESIDFQTPTQTGCTYDWSFSTGGSNPLPVHNFQQNPDLALPVGPITLTLTVTNSVGCSASFSKNINTVDKTFTGTISKSGTGGCIGDGPVSISYTPPPLGGDDDIATTYQWMEGNTPVPGAEAQQNPFITSTSGTYWVKVGNANGCTKNIFKNTKATVYFVPPSIIVITGFHTVCLNSSVELTASTVPYNDNAQYIWHRNDSAAVYSNAASMTDSPSAVGTYTYTVTVKVPAGGGTFCQSTKTFVVEVIEGPTVTVYYDNVGCNPYKFTLHADANLTGGTYLWSNGSSGQSIGATIGGAYQVLYTSEQGCTATAQVQVPRSPDSYLWEFPSGCYSFCNKIDYFRKFLGPAIVNFNDGWEWNSNFPPSLTQTGSGEMPTYDIATTINQGNFSNTYQMILKTPTCDYVSKPASINFFACANSCNLHTFTPSATNPKKVVTPVLHYELRFNFAPGAKVINIASIASGTGNVGFVSPSFINVPAAGLTNVVIRFYPNDITNPAPIKLALTANVNGTICESFQPIVIPNPNPARIGHASVDDSTYLNLIPNPSSSFVNIDYQFDQTPAKKVIELYDLMGRLIDQKEVTETTGVWELNLERLASGQYIVVMKQNDQVVQQKNLLKSK